MKLGKGDMWDVYDSVDLFCVTTNAVVNGGGKLVMASGMSLQVAMRFPKVPGAIGATLKKKYGIKSGTCPDFHLLVSENWPSVKLACFQSKRVWWGATDFHLLEASVDALRDWAAKHPEAQIALNFPAVGRGGFLQANVMPVLECLPDNVTIWRRSNGEDDGGRRA